MMLKKHILTFLLSLFILFSGYGKGNAVHTHQSKQKQTEAIGGTISEHPGPDAEQRVISSEGILRNGIRNSENEHQTNPTHTHNKAQSNTYSVHLNSCSNSQLLAYSHRQLAHLEATAHYITFRQLLI
ncbi:MAG: hypothetical protein JNL24_04620 [Bacteroidia bacterium]|nr:hypothetical protein [Bacteroidia bacterium]